jgi:hypothetical protein
MPRPFDTDTDTDSDPDPDRPVENATAPPRLCARLSGWGGGGQVGKAAIFSDDLRPRNQSPIFFFKSGKELGSFAFIYRFSVSKAVTFS